MSKSLTPETIAIIKSTAPALQTHGLAITTRMYERLFADPKIEAMFDRAAMQSGEQPKRLAGAIVAFAKNVDQLDLLGGAVERMAQRHVEIGVKPEHYPMVAAALLPAIKDVLGDAIDENTLAAWGEAYGVLADVLIAREATLYAERQQPPSGA